jgi:hypothetical protein
VDEPDVHPLRDQSGLTLGHIPQQREESLRRGTELGIVPRDRVLGQFPQAFRSPREAKNSNVPTRMWLAATRVSTAPGSSCSR